MSAYRSLIRAIQDGEAVEAAIANRPVFDVQGNVQYLLDWLTSYAAGSATYWRSVPAATAVQVGMPVYWDDANGRVDLALAAISVDPATNVVVEQTTALVIGVCSAVYAGGTVDVQTLGVGPLDISAAVSGSPAPGRYYLSARTPGMLVQQQPSISCPVLVYMSGGTAMVLPQTRDFLSQHQHYKVDLHCLPAGTTSPPSSGQRHVISADDTTKPGWLNADNTIFDGLAPAGARWGYNLSQDPSLQAIWPPLPAGGAVLFWDQGTDTTGAGLVPMGPDGGLAIVDSTTIWWMTDCYQSVPWPATYNSSSPPAPPGPDTTPPTCPPPTYMKLTLGYYVSLFAANLASVTQLSPAAGSPITVLDADGNPASAGALYLGFDWSALVLSGDVNGAEILKSFSGGNFSKGYVLEGVQLAGSGLAATASHTLTGVTATATATLSGNTVASATIGLAGYGYSVAPTVTFSGGGGTGATGTAVIANGVVTGIVITVSGSGYTSAPTIAIAAPPTTYQGLVQLQTTGGVPTIEVTPDVVRLIDSAEKSFSIPPYIGFPSDRASSILLEYDIQPAGLPASPTASVLLTFYGVGNGTIPPLSAIYTRITGTSGTVPTSGSSLTLVTGQTIATGNFLQVSTSSFAVAAGDTIFVTISRAGSDGYGSELGLMRFGLIISGG